ncbi:MAG TPA: ADP-glyceromanno-heptose 6-epimerase [Bacteroidia bacterium]|jgi:ADP-L-glycero-D-manno-heptose 6-epimerase|nr:ADP-glyceromanno-heptose 6-epimerase [Bacteroidia bacterium]
MVIVTGAAGFIGSCLVSELNRAGIRDIVVSDDFEKKEKEPNLIGKLFYQKVQRDDLPQWIEDNANIIKFVIHIGARTDTTEFNKEIFDRLNLHYTKQIWGLCTKLNIPLIYASSAATYGLGEFGYDDENESIIEKLKPLNPYGDSKNDFDKWALKQNKKPPYWVGLKFFNVYGPNEYHKGRMASVIFHAFNQVKQNGKVKLFRSHNPKYKDGGQLRDFVYVKDVCNVIMFLFKHKVTSGIYNLGTGKARTFEDLAKNTFKAMGVTENIEFIDTPADIRDKYQYFTEAKMNKLQKAGYIKPFYTLEEGVSDYVKNYLTNNLYL